jgi:ribosomal protein L24
VNPTANELQIWSQCKDNQIRQFALHGLVQFQLFIWPGDRVEASSPAYQGLQGEVMATDGSTVTIRFFPHPALPTGDKSAPYQLRATDVRKIFHAGDYVRVMGGANDGKEGLVLVPSDGNGRVLVLESVTNVEVSDQFNLITLRWR